MMSCSTSFGTREHTKTAIVQRVAHYAPESEPVVLTPLQFGFGSLECRREQVPHFARCLVQVVAHPVAALTLRHDIEVDAIRPLVSALTPQQWTNIPVLVDHIGNAESLRIIVGFPSVARNEFPNPNFPESRHCPAENEQADACHCGH